MEIQGLKRKFRVAGVLIYERRKIILSFKKNWKIKMLRLPSHSQKQQGISSLKNNGGIAQLVQSICLTSRGSAVRIRVPPLHFFIGSIAQLVQSICLTSRGSAVRIRVLPLITFSGGIAQLVQI